MSNVNALVYLRDTLRRRQSDWNRGLADVNDFTYGSPMILSWGEGTRVHIGKFCSIAEGVEIFAGGNHRNDWISTYPFNALMPREYGFIEGHPYSKGDVWIGNDVWLGRGCTIMSGVHIGDGATVAAKAVVSRDVPPYAVAAGNPAEVRKLRFSKKEIDALLSIKWWDWNIAKIADEVPLLQSGNIREFIKKYGVK